MTPEDTARKAGWAEIRIARRVQVPLDQISSARAVVDVVPDEPDADSASDGDGGPPLVVLAAESIIQAVLEPHCRCCR